MKIFYIVVVSLLSYALFRRSLLHIKKEEIPGLNELEIELDRGECHVVLSRSESINQSIYNVVSGKGEGFPGKVSFHDVGTLNGKKTYDFVYLCQPESVPWDIKAGDFVAFIGRSLNFSKEDLRGFLTKWNLKRAAGKNFKDLEEKEKGKIILESVLLKRNTILIIDDFARGMPTDFLKEFIDRLENLKKGGVSILYFTNDAFMARKIGDYISFLKKDAALMAIKL